MLESLAKHLIMIPDNVLYECLDFLDYCEMYGKEIRARDVDALSTEARDARNTVAYEARLLKARVDLFDKLISKKLFRQNLQTFGAR